jgi:thiol-disulfide isomerase/thioredoxin
VRRRLVVLLALVVAVAAALVLTAGRGRDTGTAASPGPTVPDLTIPRLDGGGDFALGHLTTAKTPTLLWFWAPWCEVCNAEAPAIERMAAKAGDQLTVVAIGGRDDAANGPAFIERHRLRTPTVLFDEAMEAWGAYAIPGQPAGILLDRSGRERGRWLGAFDTAEVLAAARDL